MGNKTAEVAAGRLGGIIAILVIIVMFSSC